MARLFALLVGIDDYPAPVRPLTGCVADVTAIEQLLRDWGKAENVLRLVNEDANRAAVIAALSAHLGQAGPGDTALFWYSGHGSHRLTTRAAGSPVDDSDQTLVLFDSRTQGSTDLADVELGELVTSIASRGAHVVVILDSCHSGSGTRDPFDAAVGVRQTPADERVSVRPPRASFGKRTGSDDAGWALGVGRHILLAASRADQTAKEISINGARRGAFSWALEQALRDASTPLSYRELTALARQRVSAVVRDQSPRLEVSEDTDVKLPFLGGASVSRPLRYLVRRSGTGWYVDAGTWQGFTSTNAAATGPVLVDVFESPESGARRLGQATVVTVEAQLSRLEGFDSLGGDGPYWATLAQRLERPLRVAIDPAVLTLVAGLASLVRASIHLEKSDDLDAEAIVRHTSTGGLLVIDRRASHTDGYPVRTADDALHALETIAKWHAVAALDDGIESFRSGDVQVELEVIRPDGHRELVNPGDVDMPYVENRPQRFTLRIVNHSSRPVHATVLHLDSNAGISTTLVPSNTVRIPSEQSSPPTHRWEANDGKPVSSLVPDSLMARGVSSRTDIVKVLLSNTEIDTTSLTQPPLSTNLETAPSPPDTTREFGLNEESENDWATETFRITARREMPVLTVGAREVRLSEQCTALAHNAFRAELRLRTLTSSDRDGFVGLEPPGLRDSESSSDIFSLSSTRGVDALDVLEMTNLVSAEQVTPEKPLVLLLDNPLDPDFLVLVTGTVDGVHIPVGRSQGAERIVIEHLPPAISTRSLGGSVRLLLRKIKRRWLGGSLDTVRLAIPTVDAGVVTYDDDPERMTTAVSSARTVLLLVHGIIGDTQGMVMAVQQRTATGEPALSSSYDLVLTVDYENLDTTVDETAKQLHDRLTAAGIGAQHQLDIVAHSMGGLVARWMIEQLNDRPRLVHRLVTLGTPHGGSPWPKIQDLAFTLLTFGLNKVGALVWPAWAFGGLLAGIERLDSAFDDMKPGSPRLNTLAQSADPGVPYYVIVGNTSHIEGYTTNRVAGVISALGHRAANLAFLHEDNDLAVAVVSARNLPVNRTIEPVIDEVASDHITYFNSHAGLEALYRALAHDPEIDGST